MHAWTPHVTTCIPTGEVPDIGIPGGIRSAGGGGDLISHHMLPDEKNSRYRNPSWFTQRGRGKRFNMSPRVSRRENFPISEFQAAHGALAWPLVTPDVRHLVTPDVRHLVTPDVEHLVTPDVRHLVTPRASRQEKFPISEFQMVYGARAREEI